MVLQSDMYDVTVIGAGPVGLYAAYYAGLRDCRTKILETYPEVGGRLISMYPEKRSSTSPDTRRSSLAISSPNSPSKRCSTTRSSSRTRE